MQAQGLKPEQARDFQFGQPVCQTLEKIRHLLHIEPLHLESTRPPHLKVVACRKLSRDFRCAPDVTMEAGPQQTYCTTFLC